MKKIIRYITEFSYRQFHPAFFLLTAFFLSVCITINYYFDFEHTVLDAIQQPLLQIFSYVIFYSLAYYVVFLMYKIFFNQKINKTILAFWISSLFGILTLSINSSLHLHLWFTKLVVSSEYVFWVGKCLKNLFSSLQIFVCLILFWIFYERKKENFFGLTISGFHIKPYLVLWIFMLPLIFWASFQPDFLAKYPTYKGSGAESIAGLPYFLTLGIYEIFYGFDFTFVELLFRGFFVIGISRIIGPAAVFPMVSLYCFLHFGKPIGECISSIFGGYILGIIAYYTRNIFGGVCIHIGVAWGMEVFAIWQKYG